MGSTHAVYYQAINRDNYEYRVVLIWGNEKETVPHIQFKVE